MSDAIDKTGNLNEAMEHAKQLLDRDLEQAASQLEEILMVVPDHAPAHFLQAVVLGRQQHGERAIQILEKVVALDPNHPEAWRLLADHRYAIGDKAASESAYLRHLQCSTGNPNLQQAAAAMIANELPTAERILKSHLKKASTDVAAIRMLAEVAVRVGRNEEAQALLEYCLELTPGFSGARYNLAVLLHRTNKSDAALREVDQLLAEEPDRPGYRNLAAVVCSRIGEYERSSQL